MSKPYYELNNRCQNKISYFNQTKNLLINLGIVSLAISLIVIGINLINENLNFTLSLTFAGCLLVASTCFLSILPINQKLRVLKNQPKPIGKNILVNN